MPSKTYRIQTLSLDGDPISGASGSLTVATDELDVSDPDSEDQEIEARRSWRGTLIVPDPEGTHARLVQAHNERGVRAEFVLEGDVPANGYIALPPAYQWDEQGEVEFEGRGNLLGIEFPDANRR